MNPIELTILLFAAGLLCLAIPPVKRLWRSLLTTVRESREYAAKMQEPGHLPPPPTDREHARMMRIVRFLTWLFIGKVRVVGLENVDAVPTSSFIVTPNHPSPYDVVLLPAVLNRKTRFMSALGVMQALHGLGGLVVGPFGAFAANLDRGKGAPALRAAIQVVASHQTLVMWPEGWTYLDGKLGAFKKGAVKIAKEAATQLGETTYIVPVNVEYGKYPGPAIMRLPIKLQYLVLVAFFPWYRRGVTVKFGKAIPSTNLPENDSDATELLKQTIARLGAH